jgi:hypothetical protein
VGYGYPDGFPWPVDESRNAATKALDGALARAEERYAKVEAALVYGEPRKEILETAKR